ncbi:glucan 1,4-alpha-glucosidase [Natronococcus sp. JC468]|uniref:glucan 1,4-alpha-glucosidase n=1 Tax=Natronococcus sp. JC468 TaxID=1961921 RepID=UPI00143AF3F7|nr:glucan 1,4-alpha-glucosidase [Natronococcus sp. JC468]NKE34900.1 glucan 1,4-alpha-glucosidase [Natronococcus sp. JC468]
MHLHDALDDVKRSRDDPRRFPGERRSTAGLFSGLDDRLVHVAPDGSIRDYSAPLSGLSGIERSRFGIVLDGEVAWFDDAAQSYVDDTAIVETRHEGDGYACRQYDLTLGRTHLTGFVLEEPTAADARLRACVEFAPDGRDSRIGQLRHGDAVEVHHRRERDVLAASSALSTRGHPPVRFEEVLADEPTPFPRDGGDDRYEEDRMSPIVVADVEFSGAKPTATIATVLSAGDRGDALERARRDVAEFSDREALLEAGRRQARDRLPAETPGVEDGFADLRALSLLRAPSGARIAGPEFDPFYRHSGGYGYTWFRDDAEIAGFLLEADRRTGLGLDEWHAASARFYAETQLEDGTWPHRVWPDDGRLAPGWAHGRLEEGDSVDYQADQTASVAAYLATYLRVIDGDDERVRETVRAALEGLDDSLEDDGLPERVQNAWENMTGRFTHTAATFLEAYAAIARAPLEDDVTSRARESARAVFEGLDALWVSDRDRYALRLEEGELDDRLDGSTLALATAHREYAAVDGVDDGRLERLVSHLEVTIEGLYRDPEGPIEGLARFEDDPWRRGDQEAPKIWTVTTAWGAHAALELRELLADAGHDAAPTFDARARALLELVEPGGPLRGDGDSLPEQFFDDGTPDSATPLGWPHAIRLATATALEAGSQERAIERK